MIELFGCLCDI